MKHLFNDNWYFLTLGPGSEMADALACKKAWTPVSVPHDWLIYNTHALYEDSTGFYRKDFTLAYTGCRRTALLFDGVYMDCTVYVNGAEAGAWKYGYTAFELDITAYVREGRNTVVVVVRYLSPNTRWYSGAGLYRNIWLCDRPEAHFVTDGIYVHTERQGDEWTVFVSTEAVYRTRGKESGEDFQAGIRLSLRDTDGQEVAANSVSAILSAVPCTVSQELTVASPRMWDIDNPCLYTLVTELVSDSSVLDACEERIGFRSFCFDPDRGFFLNGRHVKLHGACMHHDHGALGAAFSMAAQRRQFESLRRMGINSVRTSHNPPAREFMELADETGMLVLSEAFDMWEESKTRYDYSRYFPDWHERDVASWVRRDRNRPSLVMWSIGNEIHDTHTERGLSLTKHLRDLVRLHDPLCNAPVTIGSNYIAWENAQRCSGELDVAGYNYAEHLYEEHHAKYPRWCIYGSETASTLQSRGVYHFPASNRLLTHDDLQCSSVDNCTTNWGARNTEQVIIDDRDAGFCAGQYIWTGWDYIGEPTPYTTKNSYFGQVDTAGFEKDSYYIYQSEWTDYRKAPMVHIAPYWDFNPGQLMDIRVYSNAPRVELFFNGESLGTYDIDHEKGKQLSGRWQLPYAPGVLKAVAYDAAGEVIAEYSRSSFTDAANLVLSPERDKCLADGEDIVYVAISAVDEAGNPVENARNRIEVNVAGAGRLAGLDNGDSTDYDQYKGTSRRLFSGRLAVIIAAGTQPGNIVVEARSPGLPDANLTLEALPAYVRAGAAVPDSCAPSLTNNEICVRKIEVSLDGPPVLVPEYNRITAMAKIFPENATYSGLEWKAVLLTGVDSPFVTIEPNGTQARISASGDCVFRLRCFSRNGRPQPEVVSELEMEARGFGPGTLDPYGFVAGSQYAESGGGEVKLSFLSGVFLSGKGAWVSYVNLDFGDWGSDELTIPVFSFSSVTPIELYDGLPGAGECLLEADYCADSRYNQYQSNTFRLARRLSGVRTISLVNRSDDRISVKGFSFARQEKARTRIRATEYERITGDAYAITGSAITGIGNNVAIEYGFFDFGETGAGNITICGRAHGDINSIQLRFQSGQEDITRIAEFSGCTDFEERAFPVMAPAGVFRLTFMFLPGSSFDLEWFRFG